MTLSIDRRAMLWGDRPAVIDTDTDRTVTYNELAHRARSAASRLRTAGIGEGDIVSVISRNRITVLALFFGAYRIGATFAPLSHRLTPATVDSPHEQIAPDAVVYETAQRDLIRGMDNENTYSLEEFADLPDDGRVIASENPERRLLALPTDDGIVELPTRQAEWNCITASAAWGLGRDDVAPALLPLSEPDGLLRIVLPLLYVGGSVVLARAFDPMDALANVERYSATCLFGHEKELHDLTKRDAFETADLSSLDWAMSGTAVDPSIRDEFHVHGVPLVRSYGTAVAGPNLCYVPLDRDPTENATSIGRPFPDCDLRIVDESGAPVEDEQGYLEAAGPLTATGYLRGERFGEWVRTGDRAFRDDGDYFLAE